MYFQPAILQQVVKIQEYAYLLLQVVGYGFSDEIFIFMILSFIYSTCSWQLAKEKC